MKKSQKMRGLIAMIAVALFIDFIVLFSSNLSWGPKLVITGISVSGQIVAIWSWLHTKPRPHKIQKGKGKIIFDLSAKLYAILVFAASIFYTVGIWVANPSESSGIKEWILGIGLVIEVIVFVFFSLKNVKETPDERFYANLAKAASLMFVFILGALIILAVIIGYMGSLTLYMGQIFISIAALIFIFAVVYFILERRG
ncbi:putative membrane protein [Streptococcus mitis SK616]|nr:putative membrane protein [Streptococcus mitis SK616]